MAITKVSGHVIEPTTNITSHNINSSGIITATRFDGPLGVGLTDGNFSGIVTTGELKANGIGVTSLNVSGVTTTAGGINNSGGNISLADRPDGNSHNLFFGTGAKAAAYHDGTNFTFINNTGHTYIGIGAANKDLMLYAQSTGNIILQRNTGHKYFEGVGSDGTAIIYHNTNQKIRTTNTGAIITGICTATDFSGAAGGAADFPNGLTGTTATFSGNVTVGGVLTYEDVTNIDSLGIVTARTGIKVLAGGINAVGVVTATSFVGSGANLTGIDATKIITGNTEVQTIDTGSDGHIKFTPEGTERIRIDSQAMKFTSNVASTPSASGNVHIYRHDNQLKLCGASGIRFEEGGFTRWYITSGALHPHGTTYNNLGNSTNRVGNAYIQTSVDLIDNAKLKFGTVPDLEIYHAAGGDSIIHHTAASGSTLRLRSRGFTFKNQANSETIATLNEGDACKLFYSNAEKIATTTTGISVTGEVAASQDYPNYRPTVDWNFASVKKLDPRITYFRSGPASYVDEFGIVKLVGDNEPRFDHDPVTRECKGLLIEEGRTNQMIYSSDITDNGSQNSGYSIDNGTLTGDQTTAPDGTTTADKYAANSTNGIHRVSLFFTSGQISNSTAYTFSVFVKANGYDKLHIRYGGYNSDNHGLGYDLSDGTTFAGKYDGTGALGAVTSSSMIEYPNGWYRCSFTVTTASDATGGVAGMFYYISNSESTTNFAGDGSSGMYFWGAQMEVGSFPTSFIPTSGFTQGRGQDFTIVERTEFSDIFDTDFKQFSMVADYDNTTTPDGTNYAIVDLWGDSTGYDNRIEWFKDNASPYHIETRTFGGGGALFNNGNLSASSKAKSQRFATSWYVPDYSNTSSRRFVVSMGGEAVDIIADSSGTTVPLLTKLGIGCNPTRLDFPGGVLHFKRLMFYNRALSDGQLQNLSGQ